MFFNSNNTLTSKKLPAKKISYLSIGALFAISIMLNTVSGNAQAEGGKRVCVIDNGAVAFKIKKGIVRKNKCKNGGHSDWDSGASLSKGRYMTCESFGKNYLKWDYNPCYEMPLVNSRVKESSRFKVTNVPRFSPIKPGNACGASSCSYSLSEGRTTTYGYTSGMSVSLSKVFSYSVSFSVSNSTSSTRGVTGNWVNGLTPGVQIADNGFNARNYNDLYTTVQFYQKGLSQTDQNFSRGLFSCSTPYDIVKTYDSSGTPTSQFRAYIFAPTLTNFKTGLNKSNAISEFDKRVAADKGYQTNFPEASSGSALSDVSCGPSLLFDGNKDDWRGGEDAIKWKVGDWMAGGYRIPGFR